MDKVYIKGVCICKELSFSVLKILDRNGNFNFLVVDFLFLWGIEDNFGSFLGLVKLKGKGIGYLVVVEGVFLYIFLVVVKKVLLKYGEIVLFSRKLVG